MKNGGRNGQADGSDMCVTHIIYMFVYRLIYKLKLTL